MAFAGVELPENIGSTSSGSEATSDEHSSSSSQPQDSQVSESNEGQQSGAPREERQAPSIPDLDKLERFRFNGREMTPKELKSAYMRHVDYTKKTEELSQARKYADNFEADLQIVMRNPERLNDLKAIYPKAYVDMAERYLSSQKQPQVQQPQSETKQVDPEIAHIKSELSEWRKAQHEAELEKTQSWLDNQYEGLQKKYPYANEDAVSGRAEYLARNGTEINPKVLDKLFRQSNDELKTRYDKMYQTKAKEQVNMGLKGKDMGAGGGVPGQAPKGHTTIKEATNAWLSNIANSK